MSAVALNKTLLIEQGATWNFYMVWRYNNGDPVNLDGCEARMQFRRRYDSPIILDLYTVNDTLEIQGPEGTISAKVPHEVTSLITEKSGIFDLFIYHQDGDSDKLIKGRWELDQMVTKNE